IGGMLASIADMPANNTYLNKWTKYTLASMLVIIFALSIGAPVYTHSHYTELYPFSIGIAIIFITITAGRVLTKKLRSQTVSFLIICAFFTIVGMVYIKELSLYNYRHSPGLDLANAVSKHVNRDDLYYHEVPDECLSPMNFYMNRIIPKIKNQQHLSDTFLSDKDVYCIVGKKAYEETDLFNNIPHSLIKNIRYKDIDLILISNHTEAGKAEW
ncbi:MAG TPA: hypothetical protein ACFYD7_13860, partial [Candidatus Wujingus californicus]|uniref:hypothetical protein n=1 Tax=Candidatus Wujingus californicus TaxID=3367618 RepID=UPI0040280D09